MSHCFSSSKFGFRFSSAEIKMLENEYRVLNGATPDAVALEALSRSFSHSPLRAPRHAADAGHPVCSKQIKVRSGAAGATQLLLGND